MTWATGTRTSLVEEAVLEPDKVSFDGALMPDHYMWGEMRGHRMPNAYSTLDAWVTLTYLATKTEQIYLGTLVTPIPFRPPGVMAKMLSTLDARAVEYNMINRLG